MPPTSKPIEQKLLKFGEAAFGLVKDCAGEEDMSMKEAWRWLKDAAVKHELRAAKEKEVLAQLFECTGTFD